VLAPARGGRGDIEPKLGLRFVRFGKERKTDMKRNLGCLLGAVAFLGGCMKPAADFDPMKKPAPSAEMKKLEGLVGNWNWTGEMVEPSKEEMMKYLPKDAKAPETTFKGTGKFEFILGGAVLKESGSMDMGEGQSMSYEGFWMWDAKAGKYRTYFLNDWSENGVGWVTPCGDCDGFCMKGDSVDAHGMKKHAEGCMKRIDKDTWEWSMTEHGPMGKMSMKGTSKRAK